MGIPLPEALPQQGDLDGVDVADVLNLTTGVTHATEISWVNEGGPAVLYYAPAGSALNQVPVSDWLPTFLPNTPFRRGETFLAIF